MFLKLITGKKNIRWLIKILKLIFEHNKIRMKIKILF